MNIPYNKPFSIGKELEYIKQAVENNKLSGDGPFNKKCAEYLHSYFDWWSIYYSILHSSQRDGINYYRYKAW